VRRQVVRLEEQAWPPEPTVPPHGHDPMLRPIAMVLTDGDRVVSSLTILAKAITHRGHRFAASGLSSVVTDSDARNQGHGLRLVTAAREAIAAAGADLGIFTCDEPLRGFYERAGWRTLPGTVLIGGTAEMPLPSDLFAKLTLGDFFTEHGRRYAASFYGARIELYPGNIDKLW